MTQRDEDIALLKRLARTTDNPVARGAYIFAVEEIERMTPVVSLT